MNNSGKFVLPLLVISLGLSACSSGPSVLKDIELENVLPEDSAMVFVIDYSNEEQMDLFKDIKDRFPETEFSKMISDFTDSELGSDDINYEKDIQPIFDGSWKFGLSTSFPEDFNFDNPDEIDESEIEFVIAMDFEEADAFENFINVVGESSGNLDFTEDGEIKYWTNEDDEVYLVRYGDIFFLTNQLEYREAALSRIEDGNGFDSTKVFESETENNLGYMYVDGAMFGDLLVDLYSSMGMENMVKYFAGLGDVSMVWFADEDGIMISSSSIISGEDLLSINGIDPSYELTLVDDVNGEGLISYSEQGLLGPSLKAFVDGFAAGYNAVNDDLTNINDLIGQGGDYYEGILEEIAALGEVTTEEVEAVLNSPFAFAMSDVGALYPTFSLYLKVDEENAENAKKMVSALNEYVDTILLEFDALMLSIGENEGILKKDIEVVNGGGLHKIYLDWDASSNLSLNLGLTGMTPDEANVELYYGLTGNNVFVVALYPDFASDFGKNVVSETENYKEGVEKLGDSFGHNVSYFSPGPLVDIASRYLDIAVQFAPNPEEIKANFDLYGRQFVGAFKYFVSSGIYNESGVRSDAYIRIEEVK
ncbi:MAG: hypothetical protein O3B47_02310 [bacterium]|nr:hypothetical protein [bacterium]